MGKLITWNLVSLDGFFQGADPNDFSWHESAWSDDLETLSLEQANDASALLFGRVTYEGMASYWQSESGPIADFMNSTPKFVASRTMKSADWNNSLVLRDVAADLASIKDRSEKNIYVFGSANLCSSLRRHNLIDEYRIGVAPTLLGTGAPLFKHGDPAQGLRLLESKTLQKGCVLMRYAPES